MQREVTARSSEAQLLRLERRAQSILEELAPAPGEGAAQVRADFELLRNYLGKWSLEILLALYGLSGVGFENLRRQLGAITPRVLSAKLKLLESRGLLLRAVIDDRPPRVEYRLSREGLLFARLTEAGLLFLRSRRR